MALVVLLRGVNVGGHRRVRPSIVAKQLSRYDVVNIGAAGTFVVCNPVTRSRFCSDLLRKLQFEVKLAVCDSRDLLRLEKNNPFGTSQPHPEEVQFVSVLLKRRGAQPRLPLNIPSSGKWFVRVLGIENRFVFGVYRREMKTIGYLDQIENLFGASAITRNWSTIKSIANVLKEDASKR
jgi:uncharacterized protein (DUF1697 family)